MKKTLLTLISLCLFASGALHARPYHTIAVDGDISDWSTDEIAAPSPNDSTFDPGTGKNEIQNLYVTWDSQNLYIGIEGQSNNAGILLYINSNVGSGVGFPDMRKITNWNRRVMFPGSVPLANGTTVPFLCDFFFGSWNGSNGNLYQLVSSNTPVDVSGQGSFTTSHITAKPGVEMKIPFNTLYGLGPGKVPPGVRLACVASLGTGDVGGDNVNGINIGFGYLGGDSAPKNLNNLPLSNLMSSSTLNNYAVIALDPDGDGVPDNTFSNVTSLDISPPVMTPNPFAPLTSGTAQTTTISFTINIPSTITIKIFDLSGREVRNLVSANVVNFNVSPQLVSFTWDGTDNSGSVVPAGIYIVSVRGQSFAGGARKNAAVAVIK